MKKLVIMLALALLSFFVVSAQQGDALSEDQRILLDSVNRVRVTLGRKLTPLVPNPTLNQVAQAFLDDLLTRPLDGFYNFLLNGEDISAVLAQYGYPSYDGAFVADLVAVRVRDYTPANVVDFMVSDYANSTRNGLVPQIESLRMSQGRTNGVPAQHPFYHRAYREIGIAYAPNDENGRFYYLFIFASHPESFPVVIAEPGRPYVLNAPLTTADAIVYLPNEDARDPNSGALVSDFEFVRFSEQPGEALTCPPSVSDPWQSFDIALPYRFSEGMGERTLYVQLCDAAGRSVTTSARVVIASGTEVTQTLAPTLSFPTPDIVGIVYATQTAAASATAYYPYAQTIEAILTSTAAPSATPTGTP